MTALKKFKTLDITTIQQAATFVLPNSSFLKVKLPHDTGTQKAWWRTEIKPIRRVIKKTFAPLLGLWSSGTNFHIVAADFDAKDMPRHLTMQNVKSILEVNCPGAIVCSSFSGKGMKAFFVVRLSNVEKTDKVMNTSTATQFLSDTLPESLHWFDKSAGALSTTFLNAEMNEKLKDELPFAPFYEFEKVEKCSAVSYKHVVYKGKIPAELKKFLASSEQVVSLGERKEKEQFLRIMISCWNLLESYSLSQKMLAAQIGVSQVTVGRWFAEMKKLGWIENIDSSYIVGVKAKSYRAHGPLAAAIKNAIKEHKEGQGRVVDAPYEGTYYKFILSRLNAHCSVESLVVELKEHLCGEEKDRQRIKMAESMYRCHQRKRAA